MDGNKSNIGYSLSVSIEQLTIAFHPHRPEDPENLYTGTLSVLVMIGDVLDVDGPCICRLHLQDSLGTVVFPLKLNTEMEGYESATIELSISFLQDNFPVHEKDFSFPVTSLLESPEVAPSE